VSRERNIPNPENASSAELETAAKAAVSERSSIRLRSIKALIIGIGFEQVIALFDVAERTLRSWVRAFNMQGIDGLIERNHPGRPKAIAQEQATYLHGLIEEPDKAGEAHWTARKLHGFVRNKMGLDVSYMTVWRLFHERGFSLQVPRPWPDRQDEQARKVFRKELGKMMENESIELWFQDEMGVEGDPRPRRRWAKVNGKPTITKNGDHLRTNVCGMICPRNGEAFMLEFSHNDTEIFQLFLDEANRAIEFERPRHILIMDNASWHHSKRLVFGRFEPKYLPAYSPDLNPIERLWLIIKSEWFKDYVCKTHEELSDRICEALKWIMERQEANIQTCRIRQKI
jgi:putative transposase